ncbi:Universal stress protein family protein [Cupriavidus sp. YR651]|uniref:universal stress protein n=1 Tax=Cupriavidus sp. YR651 TaxID=1855315 RepID=UPI00089088DD|nr:universal stress protein [Cupriavidus sp. YR651]SDD84845.1 Universal stress protein family protein [Cupriavidus sp. YR651]
MHYATVLVHLDASRRVYQRLHLAVHLALEFNAKLIGLLVVGKPDPTAMRYLVDGDRYLASYTEWQHQVGERARLEFVGATDKLAINTEFRAPSWATAATVLTEAHRSDLVILGQHDPTDDAAYAERQFIESVVLQCGRPVLVVPYAGWFPSVGKNVMVAWNGTSESARAIRDALPLLQRANNIDVVSCPQPDALSEPSGSPPQYAADWLGSHGVTAHLRTCPAGNGNETGEMLLSEAANRNADLIVMGAYGHSRTRELVLGGVTRTLLRSMTVPVLMSH